MNEVSINQRAQQVLKMLVERYIQEGHPIGSKTLADELPLGLSSASIRNILADLETMGYLSSPHISAGRVPTSLGYRLFVNSLLEVKPLEGEAIEVLHHELDPDLSIPALLQSASMLLSSLTNLTGVVSLPRRNAIALRQLEFLPLSGNRVLVILVLNDHEVQNRVIYTDRPYTAGDLQQAANYLNTHYAGKSLLTIRQALLASIREDHETMANLLQTALDIGKKAFVDSSEESKDYLMAGQNNFLNYTNTETDLERLRMLFGAFSQKQEILTLLDHALDAEGIQIFIGKESGYDIFDECSIVTASYSLQGQLIGSLGVIGPKRMPYDRVISVVDVTSKLLSAALNQG